MPCRWSSTKTLSVDGGFNPIGSGSHGFAKTSPIAASMLSFDGRRSNPGCAAGASGRLPWSGLYMAWGGMPGTGGAVNLVAGSGCGKQGVAAAAGVIALGTRWCGECQKEGLLVGG